MWLIVGLILLLIVYLNYRNLSYWKWKNISYVKSLPIVGSLGPFVFGQLSLSEVVQSLYNKFPEKRYFGIHQFTEPTLFIRDVDLIKQVTIKNFDHFADRRVFSAEECDPLFAKNLFELKGQRWKNMRSTLSPAFSSSKMRSMFLLIVEMGDQLLNYLSTKIKPGETVSFEMKDFCTRFANDVIATSAFGIKCDSLKDRNNEFYRMGQQTMFDGLIDMIKIFGYTVSPALMKFFSVRLFRKNVENFFRDIVLTTIKVRKEQGIVRPDMIHLFMQAQKGTLTSVENENAEKFSKLNVEMSDEDMVAQALFFFFAGFETTSTLLCHVANELALNPDIQKKLQDEIDAALEKCGGRLNYEVLMEMKYLDMVVNETLRKWPTLPWLDRKCVKRYVIEPKTSDEQPFVVEKDTYLWIPIYPLHRDPNLFPDPEKFDPERFSPENKNNINQFSFLAFGIGPRNCIGARFALMEAKVMFCCLLSKYDITVVKETQIPLVHKKFQTNLHAEKGFWVGFRQRK